MNRKVKSVKCSALMMSKGTKKKRRGKEGRCVYSGLRTFKK